MSTERVAFTPELGVLICQRIADGESLSQICEDPAFPTRSTVQRHLRDNADFREAYRVAQVDRMHVFADEIVSIADEPLPADLPDEKGALAAFVQKQRLRVDARKWVASKLAPKTFGDQVAVTGPEGVPLIPGPDHQIELARRLAWMLRKADAAVDARQATPLLSYEPEASH